ncbi:MAG TPA: hypothetical protein PLB38_03735 [bacterium]|nr:hypothetical protein [bacterium]
MWSLLMGLSVALLMTANGVSAVQPQTINYQGRLYDLTNSPLSGQYDFRFRLYDDALKTTLLWGPEEFTNQSVVNGYFSAPLGSIESFSAAGLDFTDQYYLTVQIKETAAGVWDDETDPPVAFNSYAYSFNTQKLDNPDGLVDIGLGIIAGYQLAAAETALAINTAPGFNGTLLSLANDGTEVLNVAGDGELHWMDGGYNSAYFNIENLVNPYAGDPSMSGIFLDSSDDRSTIFGNIVYIPSNIGIGTMTPTTRFDLRGPMNLGGQSTAALSPMGDGRLYYDNDTQDLMLSKNGGAYEPIMTTGDQVWQQNLLVLSPTDPLAEKIEMSKSVNNLIGMKITNTNDVDNYAGAVIELKGSGADYTNNLYFGKYGDGFWVPSWAGNGVLATDQSLVIAAVDAASRVSFQVGGGYTTPSTVAYFDTKGLNMLPYDVASGATGKIKFFELAANGGDAVELRAPDDVAASFALTLPEDDGTAGQVLATDGNGILSWSSAAAGGEVSVLNVTATTFDGNFSYSGDTGYAAANAVCEAEFPGSHYCVTNEVITVIRTGDISGWSGTAWIAEGPPGYTANSNDCNGWTSNLMTGLGAFWEFNNTSGGMGWLTNCASVKPVACCQ